MTRLLVAGALFALAACVVPEDVERQAKANAHSWCEDMGLSCVGLSCSGSDSDMDGYVSCDLNVRDSDGHTEMVSVSCGYRQGPGVNNGCKRKLAAPVPAPRDPQ